MKNRTLAIGDIHGALRALIQVLDGACLQPKDRLIFLGDYVDGWSESKGTIDYLLALERQYECIFIKGNHDAWCQDWLMGKPADPTWLKHGGTQTVESYNGISEAEKRLHLDFFQRLADYLVDEQNNLFIHAGFSSMRGPAHEHYESNYSWDRTLWEMALILDRNIPKESKIFPKRLALYKEIFIGHTPTLYYDSDQPMQGCNVWNMDTGAAFYGRLSIINVETKQYWQSDLLPDLYPHEKGRNK